MTGPEEDGGMNWTLQPKDNTVTLDRKLTKMKIIISFSYFDNMCQAFNQ